MTTLEFISPIPASQQALFEFHTDFTNVAKVTPPFIRVRFASVPPEMKEGSRMTVEIFQPGWWMPWDVTVDRLVPNSLLIDSQSGRGPFQFWKHEHHFIETGGSVFLKDVIHYQLPLGLIGTIIDLLVFQWMQKLLFAYRHKKTKKYFSKR